MEVVIEIPKDSVTRFLQTWKGILSRVYTWGTRVKGREKFLSFPRKGQSQFCLSSSVIWGTEMRSLSRNSPMNYDTPWLPFLHFGVHLFKVWPKNWECREKKQVLFSEMLLRPAEVRKKNLTRLDAFHKLCLGPGPWVDRLERQFPL